MKVKIRLVSEAAVGMKQNLFLYTHSTQYKQFAFICAMLFPDVDLSFFLSNFGGPYGLKTFRYERNIFARNSPTKPSLYIYNIYACTMKPDSVERN